MSYIRCLSNPEGLYIYSDGNHVTIHHNLKPPLSDKRSWFIIPDKAFTQVCKKWVNEFGCQQKISLNRVTIIQDLDFRVYIKCSHTKNPNSHQDYICTGTHHNVIKLSYKNHFVIMWPVTWEYIIHRFTIAWYGRLAVRKYKEKHIK